MSSQKKHVVAGQLSWRLASDTVEAFLTERGGHLAPVVFDRKGGGFSPFAVAPWAEENADASMPSISKVLRGDFFCMPFGANEREVQGEKHPLHGETANNLWEFVGQTSAGGIDELRVRMETRQRPGSVEKIISLRDGEPAVYSRHKVLGTGKMNIGHHATLRFPDVENAGLISTSAFDLGLVFPGPFEDPARGGYSCLKPGAKFTSLDKVPLAAGGFADISRYPARRGFEDLAILATRQTEGFAWAAAVFSGYAWISLKDPKVLRQTLFWMSNGGRHYPPWNGRHVNTLGLEEITSWPTGLAESVESNPFSRQGYATCLKLSNTEPLVINTIMAAVPVSGKFDHVRSIEAKRGGVLITSRSGKREKIALDLEHLQLARKPGGKKKH